jgi:hypothetical protein
MLLSLMLWVVVLAWNSYEVPKFLFQQIVGSTDEEYPFLVIAEARCTAQFISI